MKSLKYIYHLLFAIMATSTFLMSCEDDNGVYVEEPKGTPTIRYIRVTEPASSDSLIARAELGATIAIIGENLGGTREIRFNDKVATLQPTWVTNRTVIVSVPLLAPDEITDKLYLVDSKGNTLEYPFEVTIPPPTVAAARNEWPQVQNGEDLVIIGDYFFEPLSVTFSGGLQGEIVSVEQTQVVVSIPEGATEGPVTVQTNFGTTESSFHLWDSRNIVLNFDDLVANGWRIGMSESSPEHALDGNYLVVRGAIDANQRDEGPGAPAQSPFTMEYWGGNDANRTENFYPLYPGSYREYALKFEAKVVTWFGGYLNLCLSTPEHAGNNQEIWSNSLNARAIWAPWTDENEEFSTETWITVVVPMTEFQYHMGQSDERGVYYDGGQKFIESAAGSFSTWFLGSPENEGNHVEFYIDNIRFVPLQ